MKLVNWLRGKGYTYKKLYGVGSEHGAPTDGRPMGRTAYISSSADGTITYPINHYVNFPTSKTDSLLKSTYDGCRFERIIYWDNNHGTTGSSIQGGGNFPNGLDLYPDLAFYSSSVAGTGTRGTIFAKNRGGGVGKFNREK